ncbi:T9SS type A sorting domain-containing protein, partial [candidate division KSB1 bacterium]|nr:T9SS type A sorting domain-containing protein [candidate division KSB1 bacterium]
FFSFAFASAFACTLVRYDINGKLVRTLVSEQRSAGNHIVKWNANDELGNRMTSGIYYYQMKAGDFQQTNKMILMK